LRTLHTVFHSGYINLHSQQQYRRVPFWHTINQHLLLFVFLTIAILMGVRKNSMCFDLHFLYDQECWVFLHVPFNHLNFFLWKALFSSFAHFFNGSLIFWKFSCLSSLYILVINPLSDYSWKRFLSHSVGHLFNLETISFAVQKLFSFM
jgi:hypothetical protein